MRRGPRGALTAATLVIASVAVVALDLTAEPSPRGADPIEDPAVIAQGPAALGATASPLFQDEERTLSLWARPDLPDGFADQVRTVDSVTDVVAVRRGLVHLRGSTDPAGAPVDVLPEGFAIAMTASAVEPDAYASLLPDDAADAVRTLQPGGAVLSDAAAELRDAEPGTVLDLQGTSLTVSAILPDEVAGSAEVLVTLADAERLGSFDRSSLIVRYDGPTATVRAAIEALAPAEVSLRIRTIDERDTNPRLIRSDVAIKQRFGEFAHGPVGAGGRFEQDPAWRERNVTQGEVPILGTITCHREFLPLVAGALGELEERGLAHLIDPGDYAGCWSPRMTTGGTSISRHAWGVAIDLNATTNAFGADPTMDPRVVEVFESWGMRWGGDFLTPDGMHFEWFEDPDER